MYTDHHVLVTSILKDLRFSLGNIKQFFMWMKLQMLQKKTQTTQYIFINSIKKMQVKSGDLYVVKLQYVSFCIL